MANDKDTVYRAFLSNLLTLNAYKLMTCLFLILSAFALGACSDGDTGQAGSVGQTDATCRTRSGCSIGPGKIPGMNRRSRRCHCTAVRCETRWADSRRIGQSAPGYRQSRHGRPQPMPGGYEPRH